MNIIPMSPAIAASSASTSVGSHSKLHDAAQQFEALIVGEMLRSEREEQSECGLGGEEDSATESAMDIAEGQFSKAIVASGGLGLASMIERTLFQPQTPTRPESAGISSHE